MNYKMTRSFLNYDCVLHFYVTDQKLFDLFNKFCISLFLFYIEIDLQIFV